MQRLSRTLLALLPFAIIAGLLYAALFIKPEAAGRSVAPPVMARGDLQYGLALPQADTIWAAGSDGKVWRSDDAGASWRVQRTPTPETLQDIAAWDADRAVAVGNEGVVITTGDGGRNWRSVEVPRSSLANKLMRAAVAEDGTAWAVGEVGAVLRSKDFGASWERAMPEKDAAWNGIFVGHRKVWLAGEFGRLAVTGDDGAHWTEVAAPIKSSLMAIAFRDERHGVAVGLEGVVLTTADRGERWVAQSSGTREHLFDVTWDGSAWIAVGDKGVLVTGDASGGNWEVSRVTENDRAWHTRVLADAHRWVAGGATLAIVNRNKQSGVMPALR